MGVELGGRYLSMGTQRKTRREEGRKCPAPPTAVYAGSRSSGLRWVAWGGGGTRDEVAAGPGGIAGQPGSPRTGGHLGVSPPLLGALPRAAAAGALRPPRPQQRPPAALLHPPGGRRHLQKVGPRRSPQPSPQPPGHRQLRRQCHHGRAAGPGAGGRLVGQTTVFGAVGAGGDPGLHPQRPLQHLPGVPGPPRAPPALARRPPAPRHLLQPGLQTPGPGGHRGRGGAQGFPAGFPLPGALRGFPGGATGRGGKWRLAEPRVTPKTGWGDRGG